MERIALAMHDAVAAEGMGFDAARAAATSVADATATQLEGNEAGSALLALNRWALEAIDSGISLGVVVAAMHAGVGAVVGFAADEDPATVAPLVKAASRVGDEVASTAARSLEERQRIAAKRRWTAPTASAMPQAASRCPPRTSRGPRCHGRALAEAIDCDWAAVAEREGDGRLAITALVGRGTGWAQRWRLTEESGFCARVLASGRRSRRPTPSRSATRAPIARRRSWHRRSCR